LLLLLLLGNQIMHATPAQANNDQKTACTRALLHRRAAGPPLN
jgi:hypothetical protein